MGFSILTTTAIQYPVPTVFVSSSYGEVFDITLIPSVFITRIIIPLSLSDSGMKTNTSVSIPHLSAKTPALLAAQRKRNA
ncbi:hypothetical protein PM082_000015 [Marasmius tenuissimus]|nr:hypothetical protein PM082_000015 [Marasmius tenuissimus]